MSTNIKSYIGANMIVVVVVVFVCLLFRFLFYKLYK